MLSCHVRNPRDSLLADEGSAGLWSHERLSDKETVKTGRNSCELGYSVKQRQLNFQFRVHDIKVKANRSCKYNDITCISCKTPYTNETQEHTLYFKTLMNKNSQVTYLPNYSDSYCDEVQEQLYISTLISENIKI